MTQGSEPKGLQDILERLKEAGEEQERVSIGDMQKRIGDRSYGPFLLVPAILEMSPIGGIPGVPTLLATIIALFAAQMLMGRRHFWIPGVLRNRSVKGGSLSKAAEKMMPLGRWTDRVFHGRMRPLLRGTTVRVAAALCILLCLTVPPLEFLPFASTLPMAAIAMFGLAILVKDGLLLLIAAALCVAAFAFGLAWVGR